MHKIACVTGIRKGRRWALGARPRARKKGGGERLQGSHCLCHSAYKLCIQKYFNCECLAVNTSGSDAHILVVFLALFFLCFPNIKRLSEGIFKKFQLRSSIEGSVPSYIKSSINLFKPLLKESGCKTIKKCRGCSQLECNVCL